MSKRLCIFNQNNHNVKRNFSGLGAEKGLTALPEASATVALASSERAVSEQRQISERAAKQVKIPVKL
jgi:hypothetical protein